MLPIVNETDRTIIRLLQQDARMSYAQVSRATRIPESTVRRRMERLQQQGVIEFALVGDPARLGFDLRAVVGLTIDQRRLTEIGAALRDLSDVTFAAFVTGTFDIVIHIVVQSQEALVAFLTERLAVIPGVRSAETLMMPYIIKPATAWVLPDGASATSSASALVAEEIDERPPSAPRRGRARSNRAM